MNLQQAELPKVTVVIPCYNQAHYLVECLNSVLGQTLSFWEAIVIDDASTEGDAAAVAQALGDPRIRVVRHEKNRGLAAARNTGFRLASAPLVLPLDSDDMLAPTYLEQTVRALETHLEIDCVFTHFKFFGASDEVCRYEVRDVPFLLQAQWIPGPGTLMRRTVWEKAKGYCEAEELRSGNEDWDFWLTVAELGLHAMALPEPLYLYRKHAASMSSTTLSYHADITWPYLYERHRALYDAYGAGPKFLASGYRRAARAAWARKEWRRAVGLLLKPWRAGG